MEKCLLDDESYWASASTHFDAGLSARASGHRSGANKRSTSEYGECVRLKSAMSNVYDGVRSISLKISTSLVIVVVTADSKYSQVEM